MIYLYQYMISGISVLFLELLRNKMKNSISVKHLFNLEALLFLQFIPGFFWYPIKMEYWEGDMIKTGWQNLYQIFLFLFLGIYLIRIVIAQFKLFCILRNAVSEKVNGYIVYYSSDIHSPACCGIFRRKLVFPDSFRQQKNHFDIIFIHEMIHLKRCDNLLKTITLGLCMINWYNIFAWVLQYILTVDCELSCEELALETLGKDRADDYVTMIRGFLVEKEDFMAKSSFGINMKTIRRRVENIYSNVKERKGVVAIAACVAVILIAGSHARVKPVASGVANEKPGLLQTQVEEPKKTVVHSNGGSVIEKTQYDITKEEFEAHIRDWNQQNQTVIEK